MYWRSLAALLAAVFLLVPSTATAHRTLDVQPEHVEFGDQPFHSFTKRTITIENVSRETIKVAIVPGFVPDDFSPGQPESTCPLTSDTELAAGESCTHVIGYYADPAPPFLGPREMTLDVVATSLSGQHLTTKQVQATAEGIPPIKIDPKRVRFGPVKYETLETRTFTVENFGPVPVIVTMDPQLPDDFSDLIFGTCNLGDTQLGAGETCTHVVGFRPTPFFGGWETASVLVTVHDLSGQFLFQGLVEITGRGV